MLKISEDLLKKERVKFQNEFEELKEENKIKIKEYEKLINVYFFIFKYILN